MHAATMAGIGDVSQLPRQTGEKGAQLGKTRSKTTARTKEQAAGSNEAGACYKTKRFRGTTVSGCVASMCHMGVPPSDKAV
eukprot:1799433-Prymnesium_polylepis.1